MSGKVCFLTAVFFFGISNVFAATAQDYYTAGNSLFQRQQYENALKYFKAAVQVDPNFWQSYQMIGYSYYQLKNTPDALEAWKKALDLNPNNPQLSSFVEKLKAQAGPNPSITPAPNDTKTSGGVFHKGLYVSLGGGIDVPTGASRILPYGTHIDVGYDFDENLSAQLEWDFFYNNYYSNYLQYDGGSYRFLPELKLMAGPGGLRPYAIGGLGLDYEVYNQFAPFFVSSRSAYPDLLAGGGIQLNAGNIFIFFLETKINLIWAYNSISTDIPFTGGFHINL